MQRVRWSETLETGVDEIDKQHRELFRRVELLVTALHERRGKAVVKDFLNFLEDYVVRHFSTEESFMQAYDYPAYLEHKEMHEGFVREVEALKKEFEATGSNLVLSIKVGTKVLAWMRGHILNEDKKLAAFLRPLTKSAPK